MMWSEEEKPEINANSALDASTITFCAAELGKAQRMQQTRTNDKAKLTKLREEVSGRPGETDMVAETMKKMLEAQRENSDINPDALAAGIIDPKETVVESGANE